VHLVAQWTGNLAFASYPVIEARANFLPPCPRDLPPLHVLTGCVGKLPVEASGLDAALRDALVLAHCDDPVFLAGLLDQLTVAESETKRFEGGYVARTLGGLDFAGLPLLRLHPSVGDEKLQMTKIALGQGKKMVDCLVQQDVPMDWGPEDRDTVSVDEGRVNTSEEETSRPRSMSI